MANGVKSESAAAITGLPFILLRIIIASQPVKKPIAMPPMFLSGAGLAAGIAWINSLGNLGGFFGPWYVGVMKDWTGNYAGGLYGLALLGLVAAIVCALFLHIPNRLPSAAIAAPAE